MSDKLGTPRKENIITIDGQEFELVEFFNHEAQMWLTALKPIKPKEEERSYRIEVYPASVISPTENLLDKQLKLTESQAQATANFIKAGLEYINTPPASHDYEEGMKEMDVIGNAWDKLSVSIKEARKLMNEGKE